MALSDLPNSGAPNFESTVRSTLNSWKDAIDTKSANTHTHGTGGGVSMSVVATYTDFGFGNMTGELGETQDYLDLYSWDNTDGVWVQIGVNLKRAFLL